MNEKIKPVFDVLMEGGFQDRQVIIEDALEIIDEDQVKAFRGFINYCKEKGQSLGYICSELLHDIFGLMREEPGFSPRIGIKDYSQFA